MGVNMDRMVPPPLAPRDLVGIDGYIITHSHQDHLDPETLLPIVRREGAAHLWPHLKQSKNCTNLASPHRKPR